jgi:hypothetical protein
MPAVEFKGATATNDLVTDSVSQQAKVLGAPMAAVERAVQISPPPLFAPKIMACSGGAPVASPSIRPKTMSSSRAASGWSSGLRDGRRFPDRTILITHLPPALVIEETDACFVVKAPEEQESNVCFWHLTDIPECSTDVRFWG